MPIYQFRHPEHPIVIEEVQKMTDPHIFIDSGGVEWIRVWSAPNTAVDSQPDPFDSKAFIESTKNNKGTLGDLWDQSREASEKRTQKLGYDPVKQQSYKDYSKKRNGMKHKDDPSQN